MEECQVLLVVAAHEVGIARLASFYCGIPPWPPFPHWRAEFPQIVHLAHPQGSAGATAFRVDLVDSLGKVIASSVPSTRFKPFPGFETIVQREGSGSFSYKADSTVRHAAVLPTNVGKWRVIAHVSEADAMRSYRIARWSLVGGIVIMLSLSLAALVGIGRFVERRITGPAQELAIAAEEGENGRFGRGVCGHALDSHGIRR